MTVTEQDNGELEVECAHSECDTHRTFMPTVEPELNSPTRDDWELITTIDAHGDVQIHEAYCPNHRMSTGLEELITASKELTRSNNQVAHATNSVNTTNIGVDIED